MSSAKKGSSNGNKMPYERIDKWADGTLKFWDKLKSQNPLDDNYRPSSEDLPIPSSCWKYNKDAYNDMLREAIKHQRNFAILE